MSTKDRVNGAEEAALPKVQAGPPPNPKQMFFAVPPEVFDDVMTLVKSQKIDEYGKLWIKLQSCRMMNVGEKQTVNG